MRVLHVIPSLAVKEGGPSLAAKTIAEALAGQGAQVTVATTEGAHAPVIGDQLSVIREEPRRESPPTERRGYKIVSFRRNFEAYKVSFGLTRWLRDNVKQFDLVHVHALFSFSSTMAARIACRNNVPYVVRPL